MLSRPLKNHDLGSVRNTDARFERGHRRIRSRGRLESSDGSAKFLVPSALLDLLGTAIEELDSTKKKNASAFYYGLGKRIGHSSFESLLGETSRESGRKLETLNAKYVLERWWWLFRTQGFGRAQFDVSAPSNGHFIVRFDHPLESQQERAWVNHFISGVLAAAFSALINRELTGIRIPSTDSDLIVIAPTKRIRLVELWNDGGLLAQDILDRLATH